MPGADGSPPAPSGRPARLAHAWRAARRLATGQTPGLALSHAIAARAKLVSREQGGPVMLYALLFGIALNTFGGRALTRPGVVFAGKGVLRLGVALLGARISVDQIAALGLSSLLLVAGAVAATILFGIALARALGMDAERGVLTGGATAICGASAALALSAALPDRPGKERDTLFTVVAVTAFSTLAMILYPPALSWIGFDDLEIGLVLGGSIHDVAQVVGAGYSVSVPAGDTATLAKLFRVALLMPLVLIVAASFRARNAAPGWRGLVPPPMLLGFVALAALNSAGWLPPALAQTLGDLSRLLLVTAIAGIGLRTVFADLGALGWRPLALIGAETTALLAMLVAGVWALD